MLSSLFPRMLVPKSEIIWKTVIKILIESNKLTLSMYIILAMPVS